MTLHCIYFGAFRQGAFWIYFVPLWRSQVEYRLRLFSLNPFGSMRGLIFMVRLQQIVSGYRTSEGTNADEELKADEGTKTDEELKADEVRALTHTLRFDIIPLKHSHIQQKRRCTA
jgi:hypothetical protein